MLRVSGTHITYIVKPSPLINLDIISTRGSLFEFSSELEKRKLKSNPNILRKRDSTIGWICSLTTRLTKSSGWDDESGRLRLAYAHYARSAVLDLIQELHLAWDRINLFLTRRSAVVQAVMSSHISAMLEMGYKIDDLQPNLPSRYLEDSRAARNKMMEFYFDVCCRRCKEEVCRITEKEAEEVEEVWIALMFQGICWHALHNIDEKIIAVPPRYFDSRLPVYIS